MVQQEILVNARGETEMGKLWKKSWETIDAFFPEIKKQVIGESLP